MTSFYYPPILFERAVREAQKVHKQSRQYTHQEERLWLEEFLSRLAQISPSEFAQLCFSLHIAQLRILVNHLPSLYPDILFDKLLECLRTRPQRVIAAGLWGHLGRYCEIDAFIMRLDQLCSEEVWNELHPNDLPSLPSPLKDVSTIAQHLKADYEQSHRPWLEYAVNLKPLSPTTPADKWVKLPLGHRILKLALLNSTGSMYRVETGRDLASFAKDLLRENEFQPFALNYLTTQDFGNWHTEVLSLLIEKLNDPRLAPEKWEKIPQDIQNWIVRWINTHKLEQFFLHGAGDRDRFEFWKEFVGYMRPNSDGYIDYGQGLFEFPGFGVIEFMEKGNAAYIYPLNVYREFFHIAPTSSNGDLKNRNLLLHFARHFFSSREEMRIRHTSGWQTHWRGVIYSLIRKGLKEEPKA